MYDFYLKKRLSPYSGFRQTLRVMKLTALIILLALMQVSAVSLAQKVTLKAKNASLSSIFRQVRQQTGYDFAYGTQDLDAAKPVTIDIKNADLKDALDAIFNGQPLDYTIEDKSVVVSAKQPSLLEKLKSALNLDMIDVQGRVIDEKGMPIPGATVRVKYLTTAVITDKDGRFNLTGLKDKDILIISYVGYLTKEVVVSAKLDDIVLQISSSQLDQITVIAYGTETRRFSVGSTATVTASDIEKQPVSNPLLALEGQVAGLTISPTSGAPGAAVQVQVRGQNSVQSNPNAVNRPYDQPLFIIDGVPFAPQNQNINLGSSLGGTTPRSRYSGLSPFNSINPSDIESITILKDADATSIYGTQGANGVIIITTKKGKPGETNVNLTVNSGVDVATDQVQMLNTSQYLSLRKEALANDGINLATANPLSYPDLFVFDQNKYTNWEKQFVGKTTPNTDAHASVSGGTTSSTYFISGGLTHQDYDFPGDFADNRLTLHSSFHQTGFNGKLSIDFGSDYAYDHNNSSSQPAVTQAVLLPPNLPDLIGPSGNLVWNYKGVDLSSLNLDGYLKEPSDLQSYNLNNFLRIAYQITPDLRIGSTMGYSRLTTNESQQYPAAAQSPSSAYAYAIFANNSFQTINIEPQLDYKHQFGKGLLTALIGGTYKKDITGDSQQQGYGYSNDAFLNSIASATTILASSANTPYKYVAGFARINYVFDQEFIVNLTGRRDGSSNFGPGRQFCNFGSAGLGWIFTQESLFKSIPFFTYGKLSGNYGTSGSDGIAPYQYQAFWEPVPYAIPFQGTAPYKPLNLYNPDYSWDTKKSLNIGLDLGFFHNKLLFNATVYQNRTGDQLTNYNLPIQTGFSSVLENLNAVVQDRGIEFSLTSSNIKTKNFSWTTSFNFASNQNKLISFPGLATSPYAYLYTIGEPVTEINGFKYKDVNPTTGVYEFYTASGATTYSPNDAIKSQGGDLQPIANLAPKFTGGLSNTISYKKFSLYFLLQFAKQTGMNYLASAYGAGAVPGTLTNVPAAILNNMWTKPGDVATVERATSLTYSSAYIGTYYYVESSAAYTDASYIRLKTLSLSYSLPSSFLNKFDIKSCKFYVNAQNLLTFTGYKIGDPENPGSIFNFPLQRTIVCGLSFNF